MPQAWGICDRCGFLFNHNALNWAHDWRGTNIRDLGVLVCEPCLDTPQQNGQRTFILPPDPVPIQDARPEYGSVVDNPLSPIAMTLTSNIQAGGFFGTMTGGGGVISAFNGAVNKPWYQCAYASVSDSSFGNYVAKNWSPYVGGITTPSSLTAPVTTHVVSSFTAYAPNDRSFVSSGPTSWRIDGSNNGASWTNILSGVTAGNVGESIGGEPNGAPYRMHRLAFLGDGVTTIALAQVTFTVSDI